MGEGHARRDVPVLAEPLPQGAGGQQLRPVHHGPLRRAGQLVGANVTSPYAAAGTVLALAENPEQYDLLGRNPRLVKSCVEEGLRWTSPVNHLL
ncbi:hypothetical protein [Streptomyces kanamyceticus]|uniref:hypothetical protein n=1 Tax=Streptomyces kanamyceticus TaxID=1967 RepID=UPI00123E2DE5|nr:hypothetical protein [Streptomyces kanamyceticus]